jgi:uncharacterized protein YutE (UPF0331/DUF86 family)
MVNRDLIAAKLADLADRVARVRRHCPVDAAKLGADGDVLDLVSFNLMLAVQICSDIASHIIADQGWPVARSLAEGFERLCNRGVIQQATSDALCRAVGLRNVVAHGYADIDVGMVHEAGTQGLGDLGAFAREVSAWLTGQAASGSGEEDSTAP